MTDAQAPTTLWDISQPIRGGLPVWPGDTAFEAHRTRQLGVGGSPVNVGKIGLSTHTGAHADAPFHYLADGLTAEALDLQRYLGPCRVIDVRHARGLVRLAEVTAQLEGVPPRVLLRTFAHFPADAWVSDFVAIAPELIDVIAARGVVLIGTDAPSIDPEHSKELLAHHAAHRGGLAILEGLVLDDVPPGDYELIALPLPLVGLDAAPVRAVLRALVR